MSEDKAVGVNSSPQTWLAVAVRQSRKRVMIGVGTLTVALVLTLGIIAARQWASHQFRPREVRVVVSLIPVVPDLGIGPRVQLQIAAPKSREGRILYVQDGLDARLLGVRAGLSLTTIPVDLGLSDGLVQAIDLSEDGQALAATNGDTATFWTEKGQSWLKASKLPGAIPGEGSFFHCLDISPNRAVLALGETGQVRLWRGGLTTGRAIACPGMGRLTAVCFHPSGDKLAVASADGQVYVLDAVTGQIETHASFAMSAAGRTAAEIVNPVNDGCLAFNETGTILAMGFSKGRVALWAWESELRLAFYANLNQKPVRRLVWSKDSQVLAILTGDRLIAYRISGQRKGALLPDWDEIASMRVEDEGAAFAFDASNNLLVTTYAQRQATPNLLLSRYSLPPEKKPAPTPPSEGLPAPAVEHST